MTRVICYVDGLNLYYGLKHRQWRNYLWLDIPKLARDILASVAAHDTLIATKYFTAPMLGDPGRASRQSVYLDALSSEPTLEVHKGTIRVTTVWCPNCGKPYAERHEKETDTGMAAEIIKDAFTDAFDGALLMTGDTDFAPVARIVESHFPGKRVILARPPNRGPCDDLRKYCDQYIRIKADRLSVCQYPNEVTTSKGFKVTRPPSFGWPWAPNEMHN